MAINCNNNITQGLPRPCITSGGVADTIYLSTHTDAAIWTSSTQSIIIGATATNTFYSFSTDIEQISVEAPVEISRENGTIRYQTNVNIKYNNWDNTARTSFEELVASFTTAIIPLNNGETLLLGRTIPGRASEANISTGTLLSDMSGFTLTLNFISTEPVYLCDWALLEDDLTIV